MKMNVYVGSKSQTSVAVEVEGFGLDQRAVQQSAIQFARARHRIADPITLTEHEAAVRNRRQILAQFAPKMPDLNRTTPFYQLREDNRYDRN